MEANPLLWFVKCDYEKNVLDWREDLILFHFYCQSTLLLSGKLDVNKLLLYAMLDWWKIWVKENIEEKLKKKNLKKKKGFKINKLLL